MGSTMSAIPAFDDFTEVDYMSRDDIWPSEESIAKEANNNPPTEESPEASTSCPPINSSYQPAGTVDCTDADPALTEAMRRHDISDTSDDEDHSFELIGDEDTQGQSTPIEIPKTMVNMGWDGGALGAMPSELLETMMVSDGRNDDRRARFGNIQLNNTKLQKVTPIPIPDMTRIEDDSRKIFLIHFLDFVAKHYEDMTIVIKPLIYLDSKFVINIIHNLAARTCNIKLDEHEQFFFDNILRILEYQPDMYVTAFVPMHQNEIHLKRITGQGIRCHGIEARAKRFKDALLAGKELPTNMDELMHVYGPLAYDEKSYFDETLKVEFLLTVYNLVKNEHRELTYFFRSIEWNEKNKLRERVILLNEKNYNCNENTLEGVLFKLIQQHMEGCKYELELCDYGSYFVMFKGYSKSRRHEENDDSENYDEGCGSEDDENDYPDNYTDDEPDDRENDGNHVENFESKQEIDGNEDEELIDEETDYSSDTLSEEGSDDEMSTSDESEYFDYNESGEKENNSTEIIKYNKLNDESKTASNVHLHEQTQAEKFDVKIVYVTINDLFSEDTPKFIQGIIACDIEKSKELPFLVCHGVHSNAIVYSCQTKNSYAWLLQTCFDHYFAPSTKEVDKMSLKINCYYDMKENDLFRLIEMYNNELSTKHWSVLKTGNTAGCVFFDVKMDQKSVNFILKSKMSLYAGIDTVTFSIIF